VSSTPTPERLLPSPQEFETAEYALGHYMSELDHLATRVERELAPLTIAEWVAARDAGVEDSVEGPDVSDEELLELIAFLADAQTSARTILEQAGETQERLLAELRERRSPKGPSPEWDAYRKRIRQWHRDGSREAR